MRAAALTVGLFVAVALLAAGGVFIYWLVGQQSDEPQGAPKAAIVDQLSLTAPNPSFAQAAADTLLQGGYGVDYYSGKQVTVDFYRTLPERGYDLIIFRAHAGALREDYGKKLEDAPLFTSEPYSRTKYVKEQRRGRVTLSFYGDGSPTYFGITSDFVKSSMKGSFDGATVILMGCDVLKAETLAEAFVHRGAETVVGWDGDVSATHTDAATARLLEHLLLDRAATEDAVAKTMAEVGRDPNFQSELVFYPAAK